MNFHRYCEPVPLAKTQTWIRFDGPFCDWCRCGNAATEAMEPTESAHVAGHNFYQSDMSEIICGFPKWNFETLKTFFFLVAWNVAF